MRSSFLSFPSPLFSALSSLAAWYLLRCLYCNRWNLPLGWICWKAYKTKKDSMISSFPGSISWSLWCCKMIYLDFSGSFFNSSLRFFRSFSIWNGKHLQTPDDVKEISFIFLSSLHQLQELFDVNLILKYFLPLHLPVQFPGRKLCSGNVRVIEAAIQKQSACNFQDGAHQHYLIEMDGCLFIFFRRKRLESFLTQLLVGYFSLHLTKNDWIATVNRKFGHTVC